MRSALAGLDACIPSAEQRGFRVGGGQIGKLLHRVAARLEQRAPGRRGVARAASDASVDVTTTVVMSATATARAATAC